MGLFGLGKKRDKKEQIDDSVPVPEEKSRIPDMGEIKRAVFEPARQLPAIHEQSSDDEFKLMHPLPLKQKMMDIGDYEYKEEIPAEKQRIRVRDISEHFEETIRTKAKGPVY